MTLASDNTLEVEETITVDFLESRHGIYRYLPLYFYSGSEIREMGGLEQYFTEVTDVMVDGDPYTVSEDSSRITVTIGDPDRTITGQKTYVISYTYIIPDDQTSVVDFFYYSPLGSDWETTIDHFSFTLDFEKELSQQELDGLSFYSGRYGNDGCDLDIRYTADTSRITGQVDHIGSREAITIYMLLEDGYFQGAAQMKTNSYALYILSLIFLLLVTGAMLFFEFWPRKREPEAVAVRSLPDELSPVEVGYIVDESADENDFLALIPWWAEKGYIEIIEKAPKKQDQEPQLILKKLKELPSGTPDYQRSFWNGLFAGQEQVNSHKLPKIFPKKYEQAKDELYKHYKGPRALSQNDGLSIALTLLECLAFLLFFTFSYKYEEDTIFLSVFIAFPMWLAMLSSIMAKPDYSKPGKKRTLSIILPIILLLISYGLLNLLDGIRFLGSFETRILFLLCCISTIFSNRIAYPSDYKLELAGQIIGFRDYIRSITQAGEQGEESIDCEEYYRIYPFAIIFGLADAMSLHYESREWDDPSWYHSNSYYYSYYYDDYGPVSHDKAHHPSGRSGGPAAFSHNRTGDGGAFSNSRAGGGSFMARDASGAGRHGGGGSFTTYFQDQLHKGIGGSMRSSIHEYESAKSSSSSSGGSSSGGFSGGGGGGGGGGSW